MERSTIIVSILTLVSFLGVVFNWTVVIANRKIATAKHSFGILTANQALGDALYSTIFFFYFCPMIFFDSEFLMKYAGDAGFFLLVGYDLSTQSHFFISCNRFCAVFYPVKYSTIFSIRNSYLMTLVVNIVALALSFGDYFVGCPLSWYRDLFLLNFPQTDFCAIVASHANFSKYLIITSMVIVIDVATVFRVHQLRQRINSTTVPSDKESASQRKREMSFLTQTCLQGAVFTVELITYFILSPMMQNLWVIFFFTSFAWTSVHTLDGFITLMFNQDMKKFVMKVISKRGHEDHPSSIENATRSTSSSRTH
ncbi:unnamed protein product [Caenorhabditis brenneri]